MGGLNVGFQAMAAPAAAIWLDRIADRVTRGTGWPEMDSLSPFLACVQDQCEARFIRLRVKVRYSSHETFPSLF